MSNAQALLHLNSGSPCLLQFHHSPTGVTQSKPEHVLRDLPAWKRLHENVSGHVIRQAVLQVNEPPLYHIPNEVVADVNVLRACMIIIILHKLEHLLRSVQIFIYLHLMAYPAYLKSPRTPKTTEQ